MEYKIALREVNRKTNYTQPGVESGAIKLVIKATIKTFSKKHTH
jgi:hypothetical protein